MNANLYKAKELTNTSDKSWQIFINNGANFPSVHYVKQKRKKLNSIIPVKLSKDYCGASSDPKQKMEFYLKVFKDKLMIQNNTINIRLSGDGTEAGRNFSLLNFNFGFIDPVKTGQNINLNPNSVTGNFCLGSYNIEGESYATIKNSLSDLLEKLSSIHQLEVDGVSYNIEYWLGGDLKFISIILGVQAANGEYPCPWCTCSKKNFSCNIHNICIDRKFNGDSLGTKGYKYEPILGFIKPENVIVDILHLFSRVSDKLTDLLLTELIQMDNIGAYKLDLKSNPNRKKYFMLLEQLKIKKPYYISMKQPRKIVARDLNGVEKIKLFSNINLVKLFPEMINVELKQQVWMEFFEIINSVKEGKTENIVNLTKTWFEKFSKISFSNAVTPYMHILISHLPAQVDYLKARNLQLNSFSCQGLEKYNDFCTQYYQKCTNKSRTKMLQLVQKRNRVEMLTYYENIQKLFLFKSSLVEKTVTYTTEPETTESTTTEPARTEPATTEPATTEPATTLPATTMPATTIPSTKKRASTKSKAANSNLGEKSATNNSMNNYVLVDDVEIDMRSLKFKEFELLSDSHIDMALEYFQKNYSHINIIYNSRTAKEIRDKKLSFSFENTKNVIFVQHTNNHWITVTNINYQTSTSICKTSNDDKNIFVYDCLNNPFYISGLSPILRLMYKDSSSIGLNHVQMPFTQKGGTDCGLFSLAYVFLLCEMIEPSFVRINQKSLRKKYNSFISSGKYELDYHFIRDLKKVTNKYNVNIV